MVSHLKFTPKQDFLGTYLFRGIEEFEKWPLNTPIEFKIDAFSWKEAQFDTLSWFSQIAFSLFFVHVFLWLRMCTALVFECPLPYPFTIFNHACNQYRLCSTEYVHKINVICTRPVQTLDKIHTQSGKL